MEGGREGGRSRGREGGNVFRSLVNWKETCMREMDIVIARSMLKISLSVSFFFRIKPYPCLLRRPLFSPAYTYTKKRHAHPVKSTHTPTTVIPTGHLHLFSYDLSTDPCQWPAPVDAAAAAAAAACWRPPFAALAPLTVCVYGR